MNRHLESAIDHLREGVQVLSFDWHYVYLNAAAAAHGRREIAELIGRRMHDCYPGIEHTAMFAVLEQVMTSRQPQSLRTSFIFPDGVRRWFDLRIQPVPDGICVTSLDVTADQRRQEELELTASQLEHAQKMEAIGRIASGVAHDFNNQLTVILGLAEMLLDAGDTIDPARRQRELREIAAAAQRSTGLTKRLLALSRRQPRTAVPLNLNEVLASASRLLERTVGANVTCELRLDPSVEPIVGDADQLIHMLTNLAINSRDAMPGGGRLMVSTETADVSEEDTPQHPAMKAGRYAVLSVADTGHGMDAATKARIFEPFFTTKPEGAGTGLGLSMVYGLVKQMRGFIWVYSEVNQGTTFRLYFPVATKLGRAEASAAALVAAGLGHGEHILVIEDDTAVREFVARALRGYAVTAVQTPEDALDVLRAPSRPVDLVLVDLGLPGPMRPRLFERLRDATVRVVFMSGYSDSHVKGAHLEPGAAFLQKPFTSSELLTAVQRALGT